MLPGQGLRAPPRAPAGMLSPHQRPLSSERGWSPQGLRQAPPRKPGSQVGGAKVEGVQNPDLAPSLCFLAAKLLLSPG